MIQTIIIVVLLSYIVYLWRFESKTRNLSSSSNITQLKSKVENTNPVFNKLEFNPSQPSFESQSIDTKTNKDAEYSNISKSSDKSNKSDKNKSFIQNVIDKVTDPYKMKQVILLRMDLSMKTGKKVAQGAHASLGAVRMIQNQYNSDWKKWMDIWENFGTAKIALKINSEDEILSFYQKAKENNLPHYLVRDAGRTQVASGSITALAIGPAPVKLLDEITGHLKLL